MKILLTGATGLTGTLLLDRLAVVSPGSKISCLVQPTSDRRFIEKLDLVRHNETGWLVPKRNPVQLAETILEALKDPVRSQEMAIRGQNLAKYLFDVRKSAEQVLKIYNTILSKCGSADK